MLKVSYDHRQKQPAPEQIKACLEDLCFEVKATFFACEGDRNILGKTGSATITAKQNSERYQEEYEDTSAEITMPGHWIKDLQKAMRSVAAAVSKARTDPYNVTPP